MGESTFTTKHIIRKINKTYYMDGFVARSLEELEQHGYKESDCHAYSFGTDLSQIDVEDLPLAKDFSLEFRPSSNKKYQVLHFLSQGKSIMVFPDLMIYNFLFEGSENLKGTYEKPYQFIEQDTEFMIYDYQEYTVIINYSTFMSAGGEAFKVDREEYHKALANLLAGKKPLF